MGSVVPRFFGSGIQIDRTRKKSIKRIYIYIYKINKLKKKRKKLMRCSGTELLRVNLIEDMFE